MPRSTAAPTVPCLARLLAAALATPPPSRAGVKQARTLARTVDQCEARLKGLFKDKEATEEDTATIADVRVKLNQAVADYNDGLKRAGTYDRPTNDQQLALESAVKEVRERLTMLEQLDALTKARRAAEAGLDGRRTDIVVLDRGADGTVFGSFVATFHIDAIDRQCILSYSSEREQRGFPLTVTFSQPERGTYTYRPDRQGLWAIRPFRPRKEGRALADLLAQFGATYHQLDDFSFRDGRLPAKSLLPMVFRISCHPELTKPFKMVFEVAGRRTWHTWDLRSPLRPETWWQGQPAADGPLAGQAGHAAVGAAMPEAPAGGTTLSQAQFSTHDSYIRSIVREFDDAIRDNDGRWAYGAPCIWRDHDDTYNTSREDWSRIVKRSHLGRQAYVVESVELIESKLVAVAVCRRRTRGATRGGERFYIALKYKDTKWYLYHQSTDQRFLRRTVLGLPN